METCEIPPMVNQVLLHISNTPMELIEYCRKQNIIVEAHSPIAHGEILNQPEMEVLKNFKHIEDYGNSGVFPVYGGRI